MSADESFLVRWARRKHGAATNARDQPKPEDAGDEASPAACVPAGESQSLVDPRNLSPICPRIRGTSMTLPAYLVSAR